MYTKEIFQERLRFLREEKKLSMQGMADILQVPKSTYHNWESYDREPPYAVLCRIADIYDVSTDYLLGRMDKKR